MLFIKYANDDSRGSLPLNAVAAAAQVTGTEFLVMVENTDSRNGARRFRSDSADPLVMTYTACNYCHVYRLFYIHFQLHPES